MNVYVESNFVLELVFVQEQRESCDEIVRHSEARNVRLVIPAYSLVEPYDTLVRRHNRRLTLKKDLDDERGQLVRTNDYAESLTKFESVTALLTSSVEDENNRLDQVRARLLSTCQVIPLAAATLEAAAQYETKYGLTRQDAVVYASVLSHLARSTPPVSCFLNRDSKHFGDSNIRDELNRRNCTLIPGFDGGLEHIRSRLPEQIKPE